MRDYLRVGGFPEAQGVRVRDRMQLRMAYWSCATSSNATVRDLRSYLEDAFPVYGRQAIAVRFDQCGAHAVGAQCQGAVEGGCQGESSRRRLAMQGIALGSVHAPSGD